MNERHQWVVRLNNLRAAVLQELGRNVPGARPLDEFEGILIAQSEGATAKEVADVIRKFHGITASPQNGKNTSSPGLIDIFEQTKAKYGRLQVAELGVIYERYFHRIGYGAQEAIEDVGAMRK